MGLWPLVVLFFIGSLLGACWFLTIEDELARLLRQRARARNFWTAFLTAGVPLLAAFGLFWAHGGYSALAWLFTGVCFSSAALEVIGLCLPVEYYPARLKKK